MPRTLFRNDPSNSAVSASDSGNSFLARSRSSARAFQIACPGLDAYMISSRNAGKTWGAPERLSAESMRFNWIADGGFGRMLGDYETLSFEPMVGF